MNNDEYKENMEDSIYEFHKRLMKEHPLRGLFLEITLRCNAHCEHCGSSCGDIIQKNELTTQEIKDVLKEIADHPQFNPQDICLYVTGGEPLVRKDVFELMEYANSLGFPWGITTNGILINEEVVQKMVDTNMYSVSVSIDGLKETHESFRKVPGSFEKILHGLKLMNESSIPVVQVTTCVNKKNIDQLEDLYQLMKEIGVKNWRVIEVDPIGRAKDNDEILLNKDEYRRMIDFLEEKMLTPGYPVVCYGCGHFLGTEMEPRIRGNNPFQCHAGLTIGSILANGDIFVCPDVEKRKELIQGNVRKDKFTDVWLHKYKPFRKLSRTENNKCKRCPDRKMCLGDAFHTWDFDTNSPNFCIHEKYKEEYRIEKQMMKDFNNKKTSN